MLSLDNNRMHQENEIPNDDSSEEPSRISSLAQPKEWTYTMRRSMQEVIPGLYLGPYSAASRSKLPELQELGITHIVCVRQDIEAHFIKPNFPDQFKYLVLNIADVATENIIQHFPTVKKFIDEGLNSQGHVLVHGNAGISRSAALVLAYVMQLYGLSHTRAYALVQQRRFCINPNDGFMAQLREYEPIYQAQKSTSNDQSTTRQCTKRSLYQMVSGRLDDRPDAMES
ncbi:serine/threonine/tyrosine-interacting protein isoform X2 [Diachasma alloeum]|uniref:serine/threonine/tyrosine-interacting protein isoform X2 n=1 Tax=Diachasma alloeum TaxID=454923 RepID=UPI0007382C12|nr:serine/threonine/tyrosine-interacting protein isoform X2 [Diachasma alloeum]